MLANNVLILTRAGQYIDPLVVGAGAYGHHVRPELYRDQRGPPRETTDRECDFRHGGCRCDFSRRALTEPHWQQYPQTKTASEQAGHRKGGEIRELLDRLSDPAENPRHG